MSDAKQCLINAIKEMTELPDKDKVKIHNKFYTGVATRIEILRKHLGTDVNIVTDIVKENEKQIVMKAKIELYEHGQYRTVACGIAEEKIGSSAVNRTSAFENCETSAWGRACGNLGLHGGEMASEFEVVNAKVQQAELKSQPGKAKKSTTTPQKSPRMNAKDEAEVDAMVDKMVEEAAKDLVETQNAVGEGGQTEKFILKLPIKNGFDPEKPEFTEELFDSLDDWIKRFDQINQSLYQLHPTIDKEREMYSPDIKRKKMKWLEEFNQEVISLLPKKVQETLQKKRKARNANLSIQLREKSQPEEPHITG